MSIDADPPTGAEGHDPEDLREALLVAASLADPTERLLEVAAVIGEALADLGIEPVVVGGLALATSWNPVTKQNGRSSQAADK